METYPDVPGWSIAIVPSDVDAEICSLVSVEQLHTREGRKIQKRYRFERAHPVHLKTLY
jgi:hypothetical protein